MSERSQSDNLDMQWVNLIKEAKRQGFTVAEVRSFIKTLSTGQVSNKS
ncbi:anti-repressor SinI family protein [Pseudalkalibacillus sp. SCS-8]